MKKLFIVFDDNSKITYTIKDSTSWVPYWTRHQDMKKIYQKCNITTIL